MSPNLYNKLSFATLILCIGTIIYKSLFISFPINPMTWDVFGYYLYLPLSIIHNDIKIADYSIIENILKQYNSTATFYQAHVSPSNEWVIKYPIGWAIFYLPFFIISHIAASFSSYPADGFSLPYCYGVLAGHLFYLSIGLAFLRKIIIKLFSARIALIVIVLISLGTNFFHQATSSTGMPHTLIFFQYTLIIWLILRWKDKRSALNSSVLGLLIGLMIITRPTEILILIIPMLIGFTKKDTLWQSILAHIKQNTKSFKLLFLFLILGALPQMLYWRLVTDSWIYYSYQNPGEGLDFLSPHTWLFTFSFRKGWLLYTPMMLFSILGLFYLKQYLKDWAFPIILFFVLNLYIVSSWTNWWYGASFGQRSMVQSYALMAIPLGALIQHIWNEQLWKKFLFSITAISFITLNLFQTWQMDANILDGSRMTKAYYLKTFLKKHYKTEDKNLLLILRSDYGDDIPDLTDYEKKPLGKQDFEEKTENSSQTAIEGKYSFISNANEEYGPMFRIPYREITNKDHAWIEVEAQVMLQDSMKATNVMLTVTMEHKKSYFWKGYDLNKNGNLEIGKWATIHIYYLTPEIRNTKDNLKVQFWYRDGAPLLVDNMRVWAHTKKDK